MIEKARITDPAVIRDLINHYADRQLMLPCSLNDIYEKLRDFFVCREDGEVVGCAALRISWGGLGEIRSLAVAEGAQGRGVGRRLIETCLQEARELGMERVFVLTYVPDLFRKFGFVERPKEELPHKVWADCLDCPKFPNCDEVALIKELQARPQLQG